MCASDQEKNESSHNWNRTSNIETRKPKGFASEIKIFLKSESSKRTFRITSRLISWRLRRFRTPTSPISVMPTVHQKHGPPARWVALTDTKHSQCRPG